MWSYQNRECYLQFHLNLSNQYFRLLHWRSVVFPAIGEMGFIRNRYSHCKHSMSEHGNKFPEGWIIDVTTSVHVLMVLRQMGWGEWRKEKNVTTLFQLRVLQLCMLTIDVSEVRILFRFKMDIRLNLTCTVCSSVNKSYPSVFIHIAVSQTPFVICLTA